MASIDVKLVAEISGALTEIKKFSKESTESLKQVNNSLNTLSGAAQAIGGFIAFNQVIGVFQSLVHASAEAEESAHRMVQALKLTGSYSDAAAKDIDDFASSLQKLSVYDDDAVRSGFALAKQFNLTNEEAKKLIEAAVDLSAMTGGDLNESITVLGKTLSGEAGKIAKLIPELGLLTEKELRHGDAVKVISERYRGAGRAATETYSGAMKQLQAAVGNASESLGDLITKNSVVISTIQAATKVFQDFSENKGLINLVATIGGAIAALAAAAAATVALGGTMTALGAIAGTLGISMTAALGPIGLVAAAITALGAGIGYFLSKQDEMSVQAMTSQKSIAELEGKIKSLDFALKTTLKSDPNFKLIQEQIDDLKAEIQLRRQVKQEMSDQEEIEKAQSLASEARAKKKFEQRQKEAAARKNEAEEMKKLASELLTFHKNYGDDEIKKIQKEYEYKINNLMKAADTDIRLRKEVNQVKLELEKEMQKKIYEEEQKLYEKRKKKNQEVANDPLLLFTSKYHSQNADGSTNKEAFAAGGVGLAKTMFSGASGAESLLKSISATIGDYFLPGAGQAISEIVATLAKGKDHVKKMMQEFFTAIPEMIKNIIRSIPTVVIEFARGIRGLVKEIPSIISELISEGLPDLIEAFIESIPELVAASAESYFGITEGIVRGIGKLFSKIFSDGALTAAQTFAQGMLDLPVRIVDEVGKGIQKIFDQLNLGKGLGDIGNGVGGLIKGITGGVGGFLNTVGSSIGLGNIGGFGGFATGGVIPEGYPNDSFLAKVQSGEMIIPRTEVPSYKQYMGGNGSMETKLDQLISSLSDNNQKNVTVTLKVGEKELAQTIFLLNKSGFRTA